MRSEIQWHHRADTDLARLDRPVRERILTAINRLAETGRGDLIKLQGHEEEWRLRVVDWRIRLVFVDGGNSIRILRVMHRREAYR